VTERRKEEEIKERNKQTNCDVCKTGHTCPEISLTSGK
jgi:hypothetical protein